MYTPNVEMTSTQTQYVECVSKDSDSDSADGAPIPCKRPGLAAVPDYDGRRYCRACRDFIPLAEFPRGQRRFTCKKHLWLRIGKRAHQRLVDKPHKRMLASMWMRLWKDRCVFGHAIVNLKQADIQSLLQDRVFDEGVDRNQILSQLSIVPLDPKKLLDQANAVVVAHVARRQLLQAYRDGDMEQYASRLSVLGAERGAREATAARP